MTFLGQKKASLSEPFKRASEGIPCYRRKNQTAISTVPRSRGRKNHINSLAPTQNPPIWTPRKKFMCLISWERAQKRDPHKLLFRGHFWGQKRGPKRAIFGHKKFSLLFFFLPLKKIKTQHFSVGNGPNTVSGSTVSTPNSVSFLGLTEFRGANSVSSFQPMICVPKRTHRVCPKTQ